jgi:hypothetical protein
MNLVISPNGVRCKYNTMVGHRAFTNFNSYDRGFNSRPRGPGPGPNRPGMEAVARPPGPYIMKAPDTSEFSHRELGCTICIRARGHSELNPRYSVISPNGVRCIYSTMVKHRAFTQAADRSQY